jgi:hypothetical protein
MTDTLTATGSRAGLTLAPWVLPIGMAVAGTFAQSFTYLNHDVAWVLWSSGRLLDGGVFGRDIVAANPPLIWWISAIPMGLSRLTGLAPVACFNLFMLALLAASLLASDRLLRGVLQPSQRALFLSLAAFLFSIGAERNFGQREHMSAIVMLPYLLLVLARLRAEPVGLLLASTIGMAAAIGIAFKPHLVAVPLLLEFYLLMNVGLRRTLVRPEVAAAITTVLIYGVAVLVFARPWLFEAFPDIARVYWAFSKPDVVTFAQKAIGPAAVLAVALVFLSRHRWPREASLMALAAVGFMASALLQWKAYSYHLYPVTAYAGLALALMAMAGGAVRPFAAAVLGFVALFAIQGYREQLPGIADGREREEMIRFVNAHTPAGGRFVGISTHPFPGFPTALYAHADWTPLTNSRLFLPAVVRLQFRSGPEVAEEMRFAAEKEHSMMLRDMTPAPDLVIVDVKPMRHAIRDVVFDFLSFYREDQAFAALWSNYEEVPGAPEGYRAYRLRKETSQ